MHSSMRRYIYATLHLCYVASVLRCVYAMLHLCYCSIQTKRRRLTLSRETKTGKTRKHGNIVNSQTLTLQMQTHHIKESSIILRERFACRDMSSAGRSPLMLKGRRQQEHNCIQPKNLRTRIQRRDQRVSRLMTKSLCSFSTKSQPYL